MRISDWSSDVCSSDLAAACRSEAIVAGRESGAAVDPDPGPVDEAIDFRALEPWRQFRAEGEFEGTGKTPVAAEQRGVEGASIVRPAHRQPLITRQPVRAILPRHAQADRKSTRLNSSH